MLKILVGIITGIFLSFYFSFRQVVSLITKLLLVIRTPVKSAKH
jgi:hypothetical protein